MADAPLRADIQAAADRMEVKTGAKREIRKLPEYLWEGETVDHMASGFYGGGTGLIVLTDRRMIFVKDGWMKNTSEDFPLDKVSSVQWNSGMMMGKLTIFASGNKAEITQVSKVTGKIIADTIRERLSRHSEPAPTPQPIAAQPQPVQPAPPVAQSSQQDVLDTLRQLGELRDAGVLTEDEFQTKKAELLSRL